jgi:hypothetical protein
MLLKVINRLDGRTWSRLNWLRAKDSAVFWKQVVSKHNKVIKPHLGLKIKTAQQTSATENTNIAGNKTGMSQIKVKTCTSNS